MRIVCILLLLAVTRIAAAQPADCPVAPAPIPLMPMAIDLAGRPGVPAGVTGQGLVGAPMASPGIACRDARPPPADALRGEPGDLLLGTPRPPAGPGADGPGPLQLAPR